MRKEQKARLNTSRIRKWVRALRSGEYKQGNKRLVTESRRGPDEFCCLGVAQNLYVEETGDASVWTPLGSEYGGYADLHDKVMDWYGLPSQDPRVSKRYRTIMGTHRFCHLSQCNDELDMSFDEIADLIEKDMLK